MTEIFKMENNNLDTDTFSKIVGSLDGEENQHAIKALCQLFEFYCENRNTVKSEQELKEINLRLVAKVARLEAQLEEIRPPRGGYMA